MFFFSLRIKRNSLLWILERVYEREEITLYRKTHISIVLFSNFIPFACLCSLLNFVYTYVKITKFSNLTFSCFFPFFKLINLMKNRKRKETEIRFPNRLKRRFFYLLFFFSFACFCNVFFFCFFFNFLSNKFNKCFEICWTETVCKHCEKTLKNLEFLRLKLEQISKNIADN